MCKDPEAPYRSGRRGFQWLKVKKPLETLDVVIVGAEWGHGKRRNVLSDYTFAIIDDRPPTMDAETRGRGDAGTASYGPTTLQFVNIGKAYGGLKDAMILEMTERLK